MNFNRITDYYKSIAPIESVISKSLNNYLKYIPDSILEKTTTPPTNRGVKNSNYSICKQNYKLTALIDWLTISSTPEYLKQFLNKSGLDDTLIETYLQKSYEVKSKFYEKSFKFLESGSINFGLVQKANRSSLIDLTGSAIQNFRKTFDKTDLQILKAIDLNENFIEADQKVTRIDTTLDFISIDLFSGLLLWDQILIHLNKKLFSTCAKTSAIKMITTQCDLGHIQTIYVGSRSSDRFLCIYLKHEESKDNRDEYLEHFTIRFELRLSEKFAYSFVKNSQNLNSELDFLKLIRETINIFFEIKENNIYKKFDTHNKTRLDTAHFWHDIFKTDLTIYRYDVYKPVDFFRKKKYCENASLALYMLKSIEPELIGKILEIGKQKFNDKFDKNLDTLNYIRQQYDRKVYVYEE